MIFDSDVMIWHLRGHARADHVIKSSPYAAVSAITHMEVTRGFLNKDESRRWKAFLKNFNIDILPIDERICAKAMFWIDEFALSHGLDIPDALIAATADTHGLPLCTNNTKDYKFLPGLTLHAFKE